MKNILNINNSGSKISTLLVPSTSTDEAVVRWDGTSGKSIQNSSVTIDDNGNQKTTNSLTLLTNATNPNGSETLWVNSADANKLYFGADEVGGGDVSFSGVSTTDSRICRYDGTTGRLIQSSAATLDDGGAISCNRLNLPYANTDVGNGVISFGAVDAIQINSNNNFFIGANGNVSLTGTNNYTVGRNILRDATTGSHNIGMGSDSMLFLTTGDNNIAIGGDSMVSASTARRNVGVGRNTLEVLETGENNIALGYFAGSSVGAAINDTISIGNVGSSLSGDIRIGNDLDHLRTFISGIQGKTPVGSNEMVIIDENNQLGSQAINTGDVVGVASSTDNAIVRFDGTTGKLIQNTTGFTCDDNFNVKIGDTTSDVNRRLHLQGRRDASIFIESDTNANSVIESPQVILTQIGGVVYSSFGILRDEQFPSSFKNNLEITTGRITAGGIPSINFKTGGEYNSTPVGTVPTFTTPPMMAMRIRGDNQNVEINETLEVDNITEFTTDAGVTIEQTRLENGGINMPLLATNPEGANTLWQRNDGVLFRGSVNLEPVYTARIIKPQFSFSQTITDAVWADFAGTWDVVLVGTGITNTGGEFTITNAGTYRFTITINSTDSTGGLARFRVLNNGSEVEQIDHEIKIDATTFSQSMVMVCVASAVVKCQVQGVGVALEPSFTILTPSRLTIERMA